MRPQFKLTAPCTTPLHPGEISLAVCFWYKGFVRSVPMRRHVPYDACAHLVRRLVRSIAEGVKEAVAVTGHAHDHVCPFMMVHPVCCASQRHPPWGVRLAAGHHTGRSHVLVRRTKKQKRSCARNAFRRPHGHRGVLHVLRRGRTAQPVQLRRPVRPPRMPASAVAHYQARRLYGVPDALPERRKCGRKNVRSVRTLLCDGCHLGLLCGIHVLLLLRVFIGIVLPGSCCRLFGGCGCRIPYLGVYACTVPPRFRTLAVLFAFISFECHPYNGLLLLHPHARLYLLDHYIALFVLSGV